MCADVGPVRPAGYTARQRRPRDDDIAEVDVRSILGNLSRSFRRLFTRVPESDLYELPPTVRREVVGHPLEWGRIMQKVSTTLMTYVRSMEEAEDEAGPSTR